MFGRGAEYGQATIVARSPHDGLYHMKNHEGIYRNIWDYIADVQPESGPAFRTTFTELFEGFNGREPDIGEQARVKFDAKHQKVEFDRSALRADYAASETARKERLAAIASAPPGTTPPSPSAGTSNAGASDLAASTADFSDTFAAIKRAREVGDLAEVERLKAEYRRRSG